MRLNAQYLGFFFTVLILLFAISSNQVSAEDVPRPRQQTEQEVYTENIVCEEGMELVLNYDGTPTCVEPENVLKLVKSGWIPQDTIDRISISDRRVHETSENVYAYQFDYCAAVYNKGALGMIVSSDTEKIPVQIYPNIEAEQCQQYGTQIHASSNSSLKISLFYEKDVQKLFKNFEKKKMNLESDLIQYQQKLLRLQDPNIDEDNLEEIEKIKIRIELMNHVIQSYKQGLNIFRSL